MEKLKQYEVVQVVDLVIDLLREHPKDILIEIEDNLTEGNRTEDIPIEDPRNFSLQPVQNVRRKLKYLSNLLELNQYYVEIVFKIKNLEMVLQE